jgi:hypothetical protein
MDTKEHKSSGDGVTPFPAEPVREGRHEPRITQRGRFGRLKAPSLTRSCAATKEVWI